MDQVQGTVDGTEVVNGGAPVRIINDNTDNGIGHTFAIPTLGVSVPMPGIPSEATNVCTCRALRFVVRPQHDRVHDQDPGSRDLSVAMLRAVRARLAVRKRWRDVDAGVYERLPEGRGLMTTAQARSPGRW